MNDIGSHTKGPHIGHPILRRRNRSGLEFRPWWVVIGRAHDNRDDEVWTQRPELLRSIRSALDVEGKWFDTYRTKSSLNYEKPFVSRAVAERILCDAINEAEPQNHHLNWTLSDNTQWTNGMLTERIFALLVEEKILYNPTVREFRPIIETSREGTIGINGKVVDRHKLWCVDEPAADVWLATRLLLLEDNR